MVRYSPALAACVLAITLAMPVCAQERVEPDPYRINGSYAVRDNAGTPLKV